MLSDKTKKLFQRLHLFVFNDDISINELLWSEWEMSSVLSKMIVKQLALRIQSNMFSIRVFFQDINEFILERKGKDGKDKCVNLKCQL